MVTKHARKGKSDKGKSGREARKGATGIAASYITRTKAVKRLQVTLKDFRRLCILKGVYPRDPKRKREGRDRVYYHVKDIAFLQHEPLLRHFRQLKVFLRRVHRAKIMDDRSRLQQLEQQRPVLTLHHLLRERYPSFHLALNDCDDALNLLCLFRLLPTSTLVKAFTSEYAEAISALVLHWLLYCCSTHSLSRAFVSIKGVYYQAEVKGQRVTWLMPHQFRQHTPVDVDYRVMFTFLQLHLTLLRFVLFKLYHDEQLRYPPKVDADGLERGRILTASVVERVTRREEDGSSKQVRTEAGTEEAEHKQQEKAAGKGKPGSAAAKRSRGQREMTGAQLQQQVDSVVNALNGSAGQQDDMEEEQEAEVEAQPAPAEETKEEEEDAAALPSIEPPTTASLDYERRSTVFSACTFLLSREVPRLPLEFLILAGGGRVLHEADSLPAAATAASARLLPASSAPSSSPAPVITHHVVDRPKLRFALEPSVHYVQPQWVFDSFNLRVLAPVSLYAVGVVCPPHLSPFVEDEDEAGGGYEPQQRRIQRGWVEGVKDAGEALREANGEEAKEAAEEEQQEDEDDELRYERELESERRGVSLEEDGEKEADSENEEQYAEADEEDEEEEEEDDDDDDEDEEEEAEDGSAVEEEEEEGERQTAPQQPRQSPAAEEAKAGPQRRRRAVSGGDEEDDAEAVELAKLMMGKKQARLYSRMQFGLARKAAASQSLRKKREEAEQQERERQQQERRAETRQALLEQAAPKTGKRGMAQSEQSVRVKRPRAQS